jgi:tRNA (mo5U34)-methyltransferase
MFDPEKLLNGDPALKAVLASDSRLRHLLDVFPGDTRRFNHGDLAGWLEALSALPDIKPVSIDINNAVRIGEASQCSDDVRQVLADALMQIHPWRKGPYELFGLAIDTEWRSDWKWERLLPFITPLAGRKVLDVGCGNGYHCWRMAGAGADFVLGVDPHLLFVVQYWSVRHYLPAPPVYLLPMALESMPAKIEAFDTVFSMGVLYHRRSPMDHLLRLRECLRPGGELVLETIVIEGPEGMTLVPDGRYSRMPNVWFLPSCGTLQTWLQKCGYCNIRTVDKTVTSIQEQRSTPWMTFDSLAQALDPENPAKTVEGYPAPIRAVIVAERP